MAQRSFFTTFEISQICEVNPTTVQNWVREKKLKAYTTPGGHRRVRREDLIAFMKAFGMPIPESLEGNRRRILIADDDLEIRELLKSVIQGENGDFDVTTAASGVEALLQIGEHQPDLLILDIVMPGMNGIEVCRKLKLRPATRKIKIVAITGHQDPTLRNHILQAGADLFFTKPLNTVEFREKSLKLIAS